MNVLIVDDSGGLAPTAIIFLSYWGHEVEVVHDGHTALAAARATQPDLVISKVRLHGLDGLTLCAAIRADPALADTAVALAGPPEDEFSRRRAHALGAAYVSTPLSPPELKAVVTRFEQVGRRVLATRRRGSALREG